MAGSSLLALIDDIATILDDVAILTKVAAKKTAGVLGDDLALNAQQVTGVQADRELPVVWAVAKGSLINKAILVPTALAISAFIPWAVIPMLMIGGAYLCFEGFEKLAHKLMHDKAEDQAHHADLIEALIETEENLLAYEKDKIKGAVRTDFVLSAEIIAITLGTVASASFHQQIVVLIGVAIIMTFGVYGIVAGIVKLDDLGLYLTQKPGKTRRKIGVLILRAAPLLMRSLSVVGTAAMFLVGGGIISHGIPTLHHGIEDAAQALHSTPSIGGLLYHLTPALLDCVVGLATGALVLLLVVVGSRTIDRLKRQ